MNKPLSPKIPKGQFALIQVEMRTGILLTVEGNKHLGEGKYFLCFASLLEAKQRAVEIISANPEIECVITDEQNRQVAAIRDENHVKAMLEEARKRREEKRHWWKFW